MTDRDRVKEKRKKFSSMLAHAKELMEYPQSPHIDYETARSALLGAQQHLASAQTKAKSLGYDPSESDLIPYGVACELCLKCARQWSGYP